MLFHVTITHSRAGCPGQRPDQTPELIGSSERLAALASELGVTPHLVLWGAACILWAEPEHVVYAVIEAPSREAAVQYVNSATPSGWAIKALPVWNLPEQLLVLRQALAAPAMARGQSTPGTRETPVVNGATPSEIAEPRPQPESTPPAGRDAPTQPDLESVEVPRTPTAPGSITELLDELDDRPAAPHAIQNRALDDANSGELSLLKGETVILESKTVRGPTLRLLATAGPCQGSIFEVSDAGGIVGRLPENPIYVPDGRLSRRHARIDYRDAHYWLTDLGSANGTSLNSQPLSASEQLHAGDVIDMGASRLTVLLEPESPTPTD